MNKTASEEYKTFSVNRTSMLSLVFCNGRNSKTVDFCLINLIHKQQKEQFESYNTLGFTDKLKKPRYSVRLFIKI